MRKVHIVWLVTLAFLLGCAGKELDSGVELEHFDQSVRPQDDFHQYVSGTWMKNTEIPPDKARYGVFRIIRDKTRDDVFAIIQELADKKNKKAGSPEQKVGDFYYSFMDTARLEELGLQPMQAELARVQAIQDRDDILSFIAHSTRIDIETPVGFFVDLDMKASDRYILYAYQGGIGMPDRDYYLNEADKFQEIRNKYVTYMEELFDLAGVGDGAVKAARVMEMEMALATAHWTRVESRDRNKTYNNYNLDGLDEFMPNFSWRAFFQEADLPQAEAMIVRQPSYFQAFDRLFVEYPVDDWKTYFTWHLLNDFAPFLPAAFVDARFEFYSKTIQGREVNLPRWERGTNLVNSVIGEVLGKVYVERHFKPEAKQRMVTLVNNLKLAYEERIKTRDWMDPETKEEALKKLSKFGTKIGYPNKWRDYSDLEVKPDQLVQNVINAGINNFNYETAKIGQPKDPEEWFMNPQTVNAGYHPILNEILFPAAILQPPFFQVEADDAVNYGAIGAAIGHEMTHGFDDQGRKSDGDGILRDWWTEDDDRRFRERAQVLIKQFNQYNPIDTMHVNGELTQGENIADLGGLTISYNAYHMSLNDKETPVLDGFTGDQRFFIGWAQVWREKIRDEELRRRIITDVHSPGIYRVIGIMSNMPQFYAAFDVQEGDPMYRSSEVRAEIW
jgi:predicted metalloendopeptidase